MKEVFAVATRTERAVHDDGVVPQCIDGRRQQLRHARTHYWYVSVVFFYVVGDVLILCHSPLSPSLKAPEFAVWFGR